MTCLLFPGKWNPVLIPSGYESKEKMDEFQSKLLFACLRMSEGLSPTRSFREKTAYTFLSLVSSFQENEYYFYSFATFLEPVYSSKVLRFVFISYLT